MHGLDHELVDVGQGVGEVFGLAAVVGRHVLQQRFLAEIEAHHLRHVDVDRLVVGDAGADRVGQGQVAGPRGEVQARRAEHRFGSKYERVDIVVVDAPVDHVDPGQAAGAAHVADFILDQQVGALDQVDAHLVGEEGVLVIGAVVDARGQQHHGRLTLAVRRGDRAQGFEQFVAVVRDRGDAGATEQLREQPHHDFAILDHVGNAGRGPAVVLEHVVLVRAGAHHVDAGNVRVDIVRQVEVDHFRAELRVVEDQAFGDAIGLENLAIVVDVVDEGIQGAHALLEALAQALPFGLGHHAWNQIERNQAFRVAALGIDGEGDADAPEQYFCFATLEGELFGRQRFEPGIDQCIGWPNMVGPTHLVEDRGAF